MSQEKALVPVDQRTVSFYGDEITAVLVATDGSEQVFVPIRPICDLLGIAWSSQRRRILRDPILSEVMRPVTVTVTGTGQQVDVLSLPLPFLNGWVRLFTRTLIAAQQPQVVSNTCKGNKVSIRRKNDVNIASL